MAERDGSMERGVIIPGLEQAAGEPTGDGHAETETPAQALESAGTPKEREDLVRRLIRQQRGSLDLRGAMLDQVDLHETDLAGVQLRGASLGGADLHGSMLEDSDLGDTSLRFANLEGAVLEGAILHRADLWGARLVGANLQGANLEGATLDEVVLRDADLSQTCLQSATLGKADLSGANLEAADLTGAVLHGATLRGAILRNARLQGVDLSSADITHVHLSGAWLDETRLRQEQLGGATGEELAREYDLAARAYYALENNFTGLGDLDAGRWAYGKRRRMQKLATRARAWEAGRARHWWTALCLLVSYLGDQLAEWVCDYGESVPRVLITLAALPVLFAVLYGVSGDVVYVDSGSLGPSGAPVRNPIHLSIFTLFALTAQPTTGMAVNNELLYFLTSIETVLGIFLTGLLGFVAGNRIRR